MASSEYLRDGDFQLSYGPLDDRYNRFYVPALSRSVRYDRTIGLFSPAALAVAARGVDALIRNRGRMRLLAGIGVDREHGGESAEMGQLQRMLCDTCLPLLDSEEPWIKTKLEILGWMAAEKTLEIRVALPFRNIGDPGGAFAAAGDLPRLGVFTDAEGNQVGFLGTICELPGAGDQNYEHLLVYKSWDPGGIYLQIMRQQFERLWEGKEPGWRSVPLPEAVTARLIAFCPRKWPARPRRTGGAAGREAVSGPIRETVINSFLNDIQYFPSGYARPQGDVGSAPSERTAGPAAPENTESFALPLMRLESVSADPLVIYYSLRDDQVTPLDSVAELEDVFQARVPAGTIPSAYEIKARQHFHTLLKVHEDSKAKSHDMAMQQERKGFIAEADRLLTKAALCDIAKSRHATLFDEDLIHAGFDRATRLRQAKKGSPFLELASWIHPDECFGPEETDPFWRDVEKKSQRQLQEVEKTLREEGRELLRKWNARNISATVERILPAIAVLRYFPAAQKDKPRLTLVIAPQRKERFLRYLPYYAMDAACEKFVGGRDVPEEGWMEVDIGRKLSKSMFVMRVEDQALEPMIPEGHFAVFDSDVREGIDGTVVFVYGKDIHDANRGGHVAVRRIKGWPDDPRKAAHSPVLLEPINPDYPRLPLKRTGPEAFKIIARLVCKV